MRTIKRGARFKRDMKRERHNLCQRELIEEFLAIIANLAADIALEVKYLDHALTSDWADHRDCHIRPDLVLIYRKQGDDVLQLVRLGSHSELGL
jgi:mRNA interferase YafQ